MSRKELFITDMESIFTPTDVIESQNNISVDWQSFSYKTTEYSGKAIYSPAGVFPSDVIYEPKLEGWYKILITLPESPKSYLFIKLSSDTSYIYISSKLTRKNMFEEVFWRCADMTGQSISITKKFTANPSASIAALRFVPMSESEVEAYKADLARTDTKKLYVHQDMGNYGWTSEQCKNVDWRTVAGVFKDSDTKWLTIEFYGNANLHVFKDVIDEAHLLGIKVSVANRMGLWGCGFPYHLKSSGEAYTDAHPELHCVDRDGTVTYALSYAFEEVRKQKIENFILAARQGADAVNILANRGCPYILFEKPVAEKFFEKYGEYPYEYPLDNPKVLDIHCQIMTQYFRELRDALDKEFGKNKIQIHLWGFNSIDDCRNIGFDLYSLAKEGLINSVETHTRRFRENTPPEIMRDDDPTKIDMEKYKVFIKDKDHNKSAYLEYDEAINYQYPNSRGEMVGPTSSGDNIRKWEVFAKNTGIPVYHEMRHMFNHEDTRKFLKELFDNGGQNIAMFNAAHVAYCTPFWSYIKNTGHTDEVLDMDNYPYGHNSVKVLSIDGIKYNRYQPEWN